MNIFKKLKKNMITIIFLVFIFGMFIDYCVNVGMTAINPDNTQEKIEYKEEFFEIKQQLTANKIDVSGENKKADLLEKILNFYKGKTTVLSNFNDFATQSIFLNLNAGICKSINMSYIPGTTFFKHDDGSLLTVSKARDVDKEKIDLHIGYLSRFVQDLDEKGINSAYIKCPQKGVCTDNKLPVGFKNNQKDIENKYIKERLAKSDINVLDLSEKMIKNDEDVTDKFYKTDHHWKTECGIEASKYISEYLNSVYNYGIDTEIFDMSNYDVKVYEKCLLGSTGINSTKVFVDTEDLNIYFPKAENKFSFEIPTKNVNLEGDFDVFINWENLNDKKEWPFNAYASYIYANSAYLKIENKSLDDEHKVLVIKDSFANVVVPYLAQSVKRIDVVDMRIEQTDHFSGDIMALIEENNYDMVLFIFSDFSYQHDRLFLK